jgi:uracil-DNA glycosylase family 4
VRSETISEESDISSLFKSLKEIDPLFFDEIQRKVSCDWCLVEINRYKPKTKYGKLVLCGMFRNDGALKTLFVGLAPSYRRFDDRVRAFFPKNLNEGSSGALFMRSLLRSGFLKQFDVYITNLVKCSSPTNETPSDKIVLQNLPILKRELELVKPDAIIAMGGVTKNYINAYVSGEWSKSQFYTIHHPTFFLRGGDPMRCLIELRHLKEGIEWQSR